MLIRLRAFPFFLLIVFFSLMMTIGSLPGEANALSAHFGDKPLHLAAYVIMCVLTHRSIASTRGVRAISSLIFVALLGLLDEAIQSFLPYRNASLLDWCFDMGAALIVTVFFWLRSGSTDSIHAPKIHAGQVHAD